MRIGGQSRGVVTLWNPCDRRWKYSCELTVDGLLIRITEMTYELLVRFPALDDVAFRSMVSLHVTIHTPIPPDDGLTHIHPHHHLPIRLVPANLDPLRIVLDCTSFADASVSHGSSSAHHRLLCCGSGRVCCPIPHPGESKGDIDNLHAIL